MESKDAGRGEVVLEDGSKYVGDLVVGADGVHVSSPRIMNEEALIEKHSLALWLPLWEKIGASSTPAKTASDSWFP